MSVFADSAHRKLLCGDWGVLFACGGWSRFSFTARIACPPQHLTSAARASRITTSVRPMLRPYGRSRSSIHAEGSGRLLRTHAELGCAPFDK